MLNKDNQRELAYVVIVDNITPIEGYDKVELAHVGGWTIVVGKGEFKVGDPAIYFEIDSQLPEVEPFSNMEFLAKKHYKIKTQKMCKSLSQGLLMSAANFGWNICGCGEGGNAVVINGIVESDGTVHLPTDESRFLTEKLGITYAVPDDNVRKAPAADKYKRMAQRHGKLFSKQPFRWLMRRDWGKKVLFLFFGRARDKKNSWPAWVSKTDEERVQNMPWILADKEPWIVTEKIDGTSTTFTMRKHKGIFGTQYEFLVCSRNVVFDKPDKKCFYETNVYTEMAEKYHMEDVLKQLLEKDFPERGRLYASVIRDFSLGLYKKCAAYALEKGIIIADTKFEFGIDENGNVILGDEMLTPDSSRFWPLEGYEEGRPQPSYDKQYVRDWLKANPDSDFDLPDDVIEKTIEKYKEAYKLLTGNELDA